MEIFENKGMVVIPCRWELPAEKLTHPEHIHALTVGLPDGRKAYFMRRDDWYWPNSEEPRFGSDLSAIKRNPAPDGGTQPSNRSV